MNLEVENYKKDIFWNLLHGCLQKSWASSSPGIPANAFCHLGYAISNGASRNSSRTSS